MVATPWGESDSLRERMLRPGPGTPAEEVSENQRQRLFGAMVASVAQRGYEATRVGDLVRISGVSKRSFYDLYDDKEACFVAALEVVLASIVEASLSPDAAGNPPQGARGYLARFAETIAAQPAAARMCLIDVYAAGPRATRLLEAATGQAEALLRERLGETSEWAEMPPEVTAAAVGAILEISRNRLLRHDEKELPSAGAELLGVMLSYRPPTEPLRRPRRAQRIENPAPPPQDHAERALRAFEAIVAEQGYGETTMEAVAKRASMSRKTLYANFGETRELLLAAIDEAGAQIVAATMPAFRRSPDWPEGVRAALAALFGLLGSRPELAHLVMVATYAGGPAAIERRGQVLRPLESLLAQGRRRSPQTPAMAIEAIVGALLALSRERILNSGPETLPNLVPLCTYLALAPFLESEQATMVANGERLRSRSRMRQRMLDPTIAGGIANNQILLALTRRSATAEEISETLGEPLAATHERIEQLRQLGLVEPSGKRDDGAPLYESSWRFVQTDDWATVELAERERISAEIIQQAEHELEQAIDAGTFDARTDRHLARFQMPLDEVGWQKLGKVLSQTTEAFIEIQAESVERLRKSGEEPIDARALLLLFEMPELDEGPEPTELP